MTETTIVRSTLIATACAVAACGVLLFGRYSGDALLYLPFAQNAARGDFFSFNPGEFSSGSTSPLWFFAFVPAYLIGGGVIAAQCIAYAVTLVALWDSYRTALQLSASRLAAAVALVVTAFFLVLPGMLMFESSLLILVINGIMRRTVIIANGEGGARRNLIVIAFLWALLPLVRPDGLLISVIDALVIARVMFTRGGLRAGAATLGVFVAALIPAGCYWGYSMAVSGVASMSSFSRGLAFVRGATLEYGMRFSPESFLYLFHYPVIVWCVIAGCGWWTIGKEGRPARMVAGCAAIGYIFMVTFAIPVLVSPQRYLLLIVPFVARYAGIGMRRAVYALQRRGKWPTAALATAFMIVTMIPLAQLVWHAAQERNRNIIYEGITDATLAEYLNIHAPQHAVLLTHEAQVRSQLRSDIRVLSLDGVTDGKVFPYLDDITTFLLKYRPRYVVTNSAITGPFLSKSLLGAIGRSANSQEGSVSKRDEMSFTLLRVNRDTAEGGFGVWKRLYEVEYLP